MTVNDILQGVADCSAMAYWYGGKRQLATVELAKQLQKDNPGTWTTSYYNKAIKDCDGVTHVCDCSGMVCHAYGISDIGSSQIKNKYPVWTGDVVPGLIAWKSGHVGIITDDSGTMAEMRGIDYDFQNSRNYKNAGMTYLLYDPEIDYLGTAKAYATGWHWDEGRGWWYAYGETVGSYYRDEWAKIDGRWYFFDNEGYIKTGLFYDNAGDLYVGDDYGIFHETSARNGSLEHWDV